MTYSASQRSGPDIQTRGRLISGWLGQFYGLYIALGVLYVLLMLVALTAFGKAGDIAGAAGLGTGLLAVSFTVGALSFVMYLFAIRAARKAVESVALFVGEGRAPAELAGDVGRLAKWLTAGQWLSVISAVFGVLFNVRIGQMTSSLSGADSETSTLMLIPNMVLSVGSVILTWLILGAVRTFFTSVLARAQGSAQAVMPSADRAATWMQFVYIVQWIGTVIAGISLLFALLGAVVALSQGSGGAGSAYGIGSLTGMALMVALFGWLLSLSLRLIGHSRLFALDTAAQLDQGHVNAGPDPWASAQ